jgi:hypothetical protein
VREVALSQTHDIKKKITAEHTATWSPTSSMASEGSLPRGTGSSTLSPWSSSVSAALPFGFQTPTLTKNCKRGTIHACSQVSGCNKPLLCFGNVTRNPVSHVDTGINQGVTGECTHVRCTACTVKYHTLWKCAEFRTSHLAASGMPSRSSITCCVMATSGCKSSSASTIR